MGLFCNLEDKGVFIAFRKARWREESESAAVGCLPCSRLTQDLPRFDPRGPIWSPS